MISLRDFLEGQMTEISKAQAESAAKLLELISIQRISQCIYVAAVLGVTDLLVDEPKCAEQLAAATGVQAPALRHVMRTLVGLGVIAQDELIALH
jgi:hypothetical protein